LDHCVPGTTFNPNGQRHDCVPESEAPYGPLDAGKDALENCPLPAAKGVAIAGIISNKVKSNIERFIKKLPTNAKDSVVIKPLPNNGTAVQATSPGQVPGSSAVYEKQINEAGETIQYTKTTYDPQGNIVHVKDKISGGVYP